MSLRSLRNDFDQTATLSDVNSQPTPVTGMPAGIDAGATAAATQRIPGNSNAALNFTATWADGQTTPVQWGVPAAREALQQTPGAAVHHGAARTTSATPPPGEWELTWVARNDFDQPARISDVTSSPGPVVTLPDSMEAGQTVRSSVQRVPDASSARLQFTATLGGRPVQGGPVGVPPALRALHQGLRSGLRVLLRW